MRVMMLAPGRSSHALRPLRWLLEHNVEVLFVDDEPPALDGRSLRGCRFARYPRLRGTRLVRAAAGEAVARRLTNAWAARGLRSLAQKHRPDLVHVHFMDQRAYCAARAELPSLVLSIWGSDVNRVLEPAADAALRSRAAFTLERARLVIVDAPDMPAKCERLAGRPLSILALPLGVDTEAFRPLHDARARWRARLGIDVSAPVFASVRALDPLYGHDAVLRAFAVARSRLGNAALVFKRFRPGREAEPRPLEQELRALAAQLGVSSAIRFIDELPVAELPELYAFVDVVVNFPTMDAFPITFQEAAACRCPVITNRHPAYRGTFAERYFPMVDPGDEAGLAELMVDCVRRLSEGDGRLPVEAREEIVRAYDERKASQRLLEGYRSLTMKQGMEASASG